MKTIITTDSVLIPLISGLVTDRFVRDWTAGELGLNPFDFRAGY